jgi:hypothetical protein
MTFQIRISGTTPHAQTGNTADAASAELTHLLAFFRPFVKNMIFTLRILAAVSQSKGRNT